MQLVKQKKIGRKQAARGFTLVEVAMSMAMFGMVVEGALLGYVKFTQQAEWNAHALSAQSLASQGAEQARAAKWNPLQWPQGVGPGLSDELGTTNYAQSCALDVFMDGHPMIVTNFVEITQVSNNPPLRQIRSDCVWSFMGRGPFTNSVILMRAADQ